MKGHIEAFEYINDNDQKEGIIYGFVNNRKNSNWWIDVFQHGDTGYYSDSNIFERRGRPTADDTLSEDSSRSYTARYTERERQAFETKEEIEQLVKQLMNYTLADGFEGMFEIFENDNLSENYWRFENGEWREENK